MSQVIQTMKGEMTQLIVPQDLKDRSLIFNMKNIYAGGINLQELIFEYLLLLPL